MKMIALFSGQHGGLVGSTVSSQEEGTSTAKVKPH